MVKVVAGLLLAQTAVLLLLLSHVLSVRESEDAPDTLVGSPTASVQRQSSALQSVNRQAQSGAIGIDEALLREVIREELGSHRPNDLESRYAAEAPSLPDPQMDLEYQRRSLIVDERLTYFGQVGQITPAEMGSLQADIAQLRPEEREAMFKRLVRALNSGAIKGRL
jgi:hypothetical protein